MSFNVGGKKDKSSQTMNQQTDPWAPAQPMLTDMLARTSAAAGSTGIGALSAGQTTALDGMAADAAGGDPNAPAIRDVSTDLMATTDRTPGMLSGLDDFKRRTSGTADGLNLDLSENPHIQPLLQQLSDKAAWRTNAMFAGAGRDLSPDNLIATARGVSEATAPILFDQYNREQGRTDQAARGIYDAENTTATTATGLDAARAQLRKLGIDIGDEALAAERSGPERQLAVENLRKQIPFDELGYLSSILNPVAGLGSQTQGKAQKKGSSFGWSVTGDATKLLTGA